MAKVKGPLLSIGARGTFGGTMRFREVDGEIQVYRDGAPGSRRAITASAKQLAVRSRYRVIHAAWRALSPTDKESLDVRARLVGDGMSGWNLYLAENMRIPAAPVGSALLLADSGTLLLEGSEGRLLLEGVE